MSSNYFQRLQMVKNSLTHSALLVICNSSYFLLETFSWSFVSMKMQAWRHTLHTKNVLWITVCAASTCVHKIQKNICLWQAFVLALVRFFLQIYFSSLIRTMRFMVKYRKWIEYCIPGVRPTTSPLSFTKELVGQIIFFHFFYSLVNMLAWLLVNMLAE